MATDTTRWTKRRQGWWSKPFLGGFLIRQGSDGPYHYEIGRGTLRSPPRPKAGDVWGYWDCPEPEAMERAARLHADLERAGWFTLDDPPPGQGYDTDAISSRIRRLPRSPDIPSYFLMFADAAALAEGRARVGGRLRIGGIDILAEGGDGAFSMGTTRRVAILPPGGKVTDAKGFRLVLGGQELEAIAGFILDLAGTVASSETRIAGPNVPEPADLPGGMWERHSLMLGIRRYRDSTIADLARATPEQAARIAAFAREVVGDDGEVSAPVPPGMRDGDLDRGRDRAG